jgi:acetyl-CoA acetyltransferase
MKPGMLLETSPTLKRLYICLFAGLLADRAGRAWAWRCSTVSAVLTTAFKVQGMSYSISSACSTGAHCIGTGMEQIQLGKADIVFAGAGEAESWQFRCGPWPL